MRFATLVLITLVIPFSAVHAQLSESDQTKFIAGIRHTPGLPDMVKRIRDGKVDNDKIRVITAILRNTNEVNIHRMRGGRNNQVYVSQDGHKEAVYDANHNAVQDGINDGSYNYFHPNDDALRHFTFDIAPWILLGQSEKDPTNRPERIHAYCGDVYEGVMRALEAPRPKGKLDDASIDKPGCPEAVAVFLLATELGKADEMLRVVSAQEKKNEQEVITLVKKFEIGLEALFASAKEQKQ